MDWELSERREILEFETVGTHESNESDGPDQTSQTNPNGEV